MVRCHHFRRRLRLSGGGKQRLADAEEGEELRPGGRRAADDLQQDLDERAQPPHHHLPRRQGRLPLVLDRRHLYGRRRRHLRQSGGGYCSQMFKFNFLEWGSIYFTTFFVVVDFLNYIKKFITDFTMIYFIKKI
jgi:hypothetical protein